MRVCGACTTRNWSTLTPPVTYTYRTVIYQSTLTPPVTHKYRTARNRSTFAPPVTHTYRTARNQSMHSRQRLHTRTAQPDISPPVTHVPYSQKSVHTHATCYTHVPHSQISVHTHVISYVYPTARNHVPQCRHNSIISQISRCTDHSARLKLAPAYQHTSSSLRPTLSNKNASYTQINKVVHSNQKHCAIKTT